MKPATVASLDRAFQQLSRRPAARNALMAVEAPRLGMSWRGVAHHIDPRALFCIASCTKLYTGALVLQLVDERRVDLERPAAAYLPPGTMDGLHVLNGVDRSQDVTVRQLLSNTSGLADYFEERPRGGRSFVERVTAGEDFAWDHQTILSYVRSGFSPRFPPGAPGRAFYSDTNFQLLELLLEAVTGRRYAALIEERVVRPLGLASTFVLTPERIEDYEGLLPISSGNRELRVPKVLASVGAQGGVMSTLDDSLVFLRAFMAGQLFDPGWIERMQQWNRIFYPFQYGIGLMRFAMPPIMTMFRRIPPVIGHSGSSGVLMFYCPDRDVYICGSINQLGSRRLPYQFLVRALAAVR